MDHLVTSEHGITVLLAGLVVVLCLHLVMKIRGEDGKKMDHLSKSMEENTKAIYSLNEQFKYFNQRIADSDVSGIRTERDLVRLKAAVRALAGEKKWTDIQKKIKNLEEG